MKKIILATALIFFGVGYAVAESTALPTVPGFNTTVGCPSGQLSCWKPYTQSAPMPIGM